MANVSMRDLFEAGAHFGHRTRYWNPKMAPYIYGARGGIHIINLEKTVPMIDEAVNFLGTIAASGGNILFVGTKRAAREAIAAAAKDCAMPYVNHRWLGGMMTNYKTIRQSVSKLHKMRKAEEEGAYEHMTKKEVINLGKERNKLETSLGGIAEMKRLPDVIFIADVGYENIALQEAKTLGIPVVAVVDTNNCPDDVDYIIPSNDDSVRALTLYINAAAQAIKNAKLASHDTGQLAVTEAVEAAPSDTARPAAEKTVAEAVEAASSDTARPAAEKTVAEAVEAAPSDTARPAAEKTVAETVEAAPADTVAEPAVEKTAADPESV